MLSFVSKPVKDEELIDILEAIALKLQNKIDAQKLKEIQFHIFIGVLTGSFSSVACFMTVLSLFLAVEFTTTVFITFALAFSGKLFSFKSSACLQLTADKIPATKIINGINFFISLIF